MFLSRKKIIGFSFQKRHSLLPATSQIPLMSIAFLLALTACGKAEDTVMITLKTNLGVSQNFTNFAEQFSQSPAQKNAFAGTANCKQNHIYAGYEKVPDSGDIQTFQLDLSTNIGPSGTAIPTTTDLTWLNSSNTSLNTKISFPVLNGKEVTIGILGAFYVPQTTPSTNPNACLTYNESGASKFFSTFSLAGHKKITATKDNQEFTVNVWTTLANRPTAADSPAPTPIPFIAPASASLCAGGDLGSNFRKFGDDQLCPSNNFYKLSYISYNNAGTSCYFLNYNVRYLDLVHLKHQINVFSSAATEINFIPKSNPTIIEYTNSPYIGGTYHCTQILERHTSYNIANNAYPTHNFISNTGVTDETHCNCFTISEVH